MNFSFIDLFAGIGGLRLPFEELGGECVFSSEIDESASKTYEINFGEKPHGDIKKISAESIPDHNLLLAGFPCQPFSIMGNMNGFSDTRGTLFFDIERILKVKRPEWILLENVPQLRTIQKGNAFKVILDRLRKLDYFVHYKVLNALDFGLPQKRERLFIVGFQKNYNFSFPSGNGHKKYNLKNILENGDSTKEYEASDYIKEKRLKSVKDKNIFFPSVWHENRSGNVSIHDFSCALRANASYNYLLVNGKRHFTPRELLRLQGFPEDFKISGSYTKIRFQTGNSVPVSVVRSVAKEMIHSIKKNDVLPYVTSPNGQIEMEL